MALLRCDTCGSPLDVAYNHQIVGPQLPCWAGPRIPHPVHDANSVVSLGEGNTPCVELQSTGEFLGLCGLYGKLEFLNPTGSFKDRGTAIMISVAREQGVAEIVEDSSGNAGASVAAYAARTGIRAHIFVPASAPAAKIQQIKVYGAQTHSVEGPREATTDAAVAFSNEHGLVYASHNLSPYFIEGTKTFPYEVASQWADDLPEHLVIPVGNGSLFIGAWKGFQELLDGGQISKMPRIHCVQAMAISPIVAAYRGGEWSPKAGARTVAGGIASASPPRKPQMLAVLGATDGVAVAVEEEEILEWQLQLARREGIYAEPTSAAAFAGLARLVEMGTIRSSETVLVPITGSGLKDAPPI
uniref:Putative Pyridoxal-phosphate dependent enzyme n=1 Tax=uncultured marine microorganism HF4000_010I05 TaxID=455517 RepID=B3T1L2_9ZZZZ|nr:putative Pyridoxal-phosphate dependent enzyme [uncultured marine microorganism HF4000_010I05]